MGFGTRPTPVLTAPTVSEGGTSRTLQLQQGGSLHYHDVGAGAPLLLLQAFGPLPGTTAWWTFHRVIDALASRFRCLLVDYPNFGRSSPVEFHEPIHDLYVRQVVELLDHLGLDQVAVAGTSTGGTVAIDLALAHPARVSRMVIGGCEASTGGDPPMLAASPSEAARLFADAQAGPPSAERIRRLLEAFVHDPALITDELVDHLYAWGLAEPEHAASWAASTSTPHSNLASLATITAPALIVHGRADRMVPLEQALRLASLLPDADLVVFNRCGHWAPIERPDDFARQALLFLTTDR